MPDNDRDWIQSLYSENFLAVYDVVLDIAKELNLNPAAEKVFIPLHPQVIKFKELCPINSPGVRDGYCQNRLKALKFLQEKGVISTFSSLNNGLHRWDATLSIVPTAHDTEALVSLMAAELKRRNTPMETVPSSTLPMTQSDLTEEQETLLKQVVEVYNKGCRSEFIVSVANSSPPTLVYIGNCHPNVAVNADTSDFEFLAERGLLQLRRNTSGNLVGKPTRRGLQAIDEGFQEPQPPPVVPVVQTSRNMAEPVGGKVFIGHGRSHVWKDLRHFLTHRLRLECDEFNRESVAGRSTTDRLQEMLAHASFAFIVMTGEDEQADGTTRARENVVHEAGLFQGRLGFKKAIILLEKGCSTFSNIDGLTFIPFDKGDIETASEEIRRVLEREGILNA